MDTVNVNNKLNLIRKISSLFAERFNQDNVDFVYIKIPIIVPVQAMNRRILERVSLREYVFTFIEPKNTDTAYLSVGYTQSSEPKGYGIIKGEI